MDAVLSRASATPSAGPLRVIVTLDGTSRASLDALLARHAHPVIAELPLIHAMTVEVHASDLADIARTPGVRSLSSDGVVKSVNDKVEFNRTHESDAADGPKHLKLTPQSVQTTGGASAPAVSLRASLGISGNTNAGGVGVAIIDSGVQKNADIEDLAGWKDFTPAKRPNPYDDFGHGTHIAGLIKGKGDLSDGKYQGIGFSTNIIGLKVLDANGQGDVTTVITAIQYAVARKQSLDIDIINISLGHPVYEPAATDPLVQAVEAAVRAGITVVVSAGNNGTMLDGTGITGFGGINSPANAPSAITVGATDTLNTATRADDVVASFSSRGPTPYDNLAKPDLVAPGRHLVAAVPVSSTLGTTLADRLICPKGCNSQNTAAYLSLSGTSMAAAVVSGTAAAVLRANRSTGSATSANLTPAALKAILEYSAIPLDAADPLEQGAGEINPTGAIALAKAVDESLPEASSWLIASVAPYSTFAGVTYTWSQRVVWGDRVVWSDIAPPDGTGASSAWVTLVAE